MGLFRLIVILGLFCIPCRLDAVDHQRLDNAMDRFTKNNGPCTAIILDAATGHLEYVYNREMAFGRCFPPGSIAKTWTAAVLLTYAEEFKFSPVETIRCTGGYYPTGNITISDKDSLIFILDSGGGIHYPCSLRKGHGRVDLRSAIVHSCNTYFLEAASHNPVLLYERLISFWHLDENTGLKSPGDHEAFPVINRPASSLQYMATVIGEGGAIQVTPLKVAQTYMAVFEGQLLCPFVDNAGSNVPAMQYPPFIDRSILALLRGTLASNIEFGTLKGMNVSQQNIRILAGKTGTASHYHRKYRNHGWTVLHLDSGNRRYVMTVFVLNGTGPKHAGKLAQDLCNAL